MMRIGTVCSGIGAPEHAWAPLGFQFVWQAEIELFPAAVLAERFSGVPNLGDMTTIAARVLAGDVEAPDGLAGGTPCQSFSIAGLRGGLSDDRGNLALEFCRLADSIDHVRRARGQAPAAIIWENVPGVLSSRDNAFGCFLAALVGEDSAILPPGGKWTHAGVVAGPTRVAAWRVLDAQYFGLAQRRQRVFVVAGAGAGFDPAAVLLERDGLRRDSPPRRGQGQNAAGAAAAGAGDGGGDGLTFGSGNTSGPIEVAGALLAKKGWRGDFDSDSFVVGTLCGNGKAAGSATQQDAETGMLVPVLGDFSAATEFLPQSSRVYSEAEVSPTLTRMGNRAPQVLAQYLPLPAQGVVHTLRGDGFDASEDGTGRGTPLVPMEAIAFSCKDHGADAAAMNHAGSHANAGGQVAVAFQDRCRGDDGRGYDRPPPVSVECAGTLETVKGWNVAASMAVRRLTPAECEALQGFKRGWTAITHRGKPAADGPRYKALGNSMAVPVLAWIGRRLLLQHAAIVQHAVPLLGEGGAQVLEGLVAAETDIAAAIGPVEREALRLVDPGGDEADGGAGHRARRFGAGRVHAGHAAVGAAEVNGIPT